MSPVVSILLVLGIFTLLGLVAWAAVTLVLASSRGAMSPPSTNLLEDSRELVGGHAD